MYINIRSKFVDISKPNIYRHFLGDIYGNIFHADTGSRVIRASSLHLIFFLLLSIICIIGTSFVLARHRINLLRQIINRIPNCRWDPPTTGVNMYTQPGSSYDPATIRPLAFIGERTWVWKYRRATNSAEMMVLQKWTEPMRAKRWEYR